MSYRIPISTIELQAIRSEIGDLEKRKARLGHQLGEIMSSSGSFAAKTPGFSDTEDQIRIIDIKLDTLRQLLVNTYEVRSIRDLPEDRIGLYCKVTASDQNDQPRVYYICHKPESHPPTALIAVTPRSPLGNALMGKEVGDCVEITLPSGKLELKVLDFEIQLSTDR